jgi:hypothetical protein
MQEYIDILLGDLNLVVDISTDNLTATIRIRDIASGSEAQVTVTQRVSSLIVQGFLQFDEPSEAFKAHFPTFY